MHAIELEQLTRLYGSIRAVDGVSFHVEPGEIFGFMGHNGAGKTTTLRMLLGLTRPTSGGARVLGHDVVHESLEVRRQCGFLPASYALPAHMTARQFLHYIAAMFDLDASVAETRIQSLLRLFGLEAAADRKLGGFSTGMTQKVGLAQALVNEPRILLLDEPTSGLDPLGRHELLEHLRRLSSERGVTVLFSSHILSDIETLCRRVAALHQGKLVAFGPVEALKSEHRSANMDELYLSLARRAA
ncbi:ABC transporter, ATPase subunit [Cystobacter fuscus DSM 2262]|uniref:ABC transporter, ATPase subunit n=1 Tax=Cystobacter fuscus (strain ATCC 25194 / DSM 2262 / NBRC 100088 / M29) TaxID=1242864 RepID=S9QLH6_CYSF2|nr:ABC transporter ATP-binding protein [Cystobacter fuscus]EPX62109.1 ABC transporter, ATPase subunit [Cystobacter fuscus DSM 2262]